MTWSLKRLSRSKKQLILPDVDKGPFKEAISEAVEMINQAKRPVLVAGVELLRYGMHTAFRQLAEKTNIPVTSTLLGKSAFGERHPLYLGLYEGGMSREQVRQYVEGSDCVILLGVLLTDLDLGIFTAHLDQGKSIYLHQRKDFHPLPYVQCGLSEWISPGTFEGGYPPSTGSGDPACGCSWRVSTRSRMQR